MDIIIVISMLSLPLMPLVIADPTLISMGPVDRKYTWEFDDLANYTLSNAVIENGTLRLAATPVSLSLTSQQDFENGTLSDLDSSDSGNLMLAKAMPTPFQLILTLGSNDFSDTYLTNSTPTFNFGDSASLLIGNDASGATYRSLMQIDGSALSALPSDMQLIGASLSLYQMSGTYAGNFNVHSGSSTWTEGTGDWNGTLLWLWVNETADAKRTNEPVIVDLSFPPIRLSDPDRQLILYDSMDNEYPSRILNKTYSGGYLTSVRLGLAVTISALESEAFSLRLVDAGGPLPTYRNHAVDPVSLWSGSIGSYLVSPAVADFNGDGYLEMAFFDAATRSIYAYGWDGIPLWTYFAAENLDLAPTAADVNLDGRMELLYPSNSLGLRVLDAETGTLLSGYTLPGGGSSQAAVSDINGDGRPEILILSNPPRALYCLSGVTGNIIWQDSTNISQAGIALAIGNFNASAGLEIAVALNDGTVLTFSASGNLEWTARPSTTDYGFSFSVARLYGDQFDDLVLGQNRRPGFVFALNGTTGKTLWSFSTATSSSYSSGLAVADINKDGYNETIALAAANGLHQVIALSNKGSQLWNCTIPEIGGIGEISKGAISLADFNGDGDPEIFIGDRNGSVRVISRSGAMLKTIMVSAAKALQDNPPLFADLTGNDSLEMITSNDKGIHVIGIYGFSYDWRIKAHDATLGSAMKNLSSAEGLTQLKTKWNAIPYPEMPANWTYAMNAVPWGNPGGDYDPVPISASSPAGTGAWTSLNITDIISAWLASGRSQMKSFLLKPQTASSLGIARFSSADEPIAALHPVLTVNYRLMRYATSGSFISDPLGFYWPSHWEWASANWSAPVGTSVSIEMRIGNTSNPGDGTWSGWSLLSLPGNSSAMNISKFGGYLQFRIVLTAANSSLTPIFRGIECGGIYYAYHGWAETADVHPTETIDHWNSTWAAYSGNGATITLNFSTNGGMNWVSVGPTGDISMADNSSGNLRLRIDIWSRDYPCSSATTPIVYNLSASYSIRPIQSSPPYIFPRIPDQIKPQDTAPWLVDLTGCLHDAQDPNTALRWYVLNKSFVTVFGENITGNLAMTLSVPAHMSGMANLTFVLVDSDGMMANQTIEVVITQVNEPPYISPLIPDQARMEDPSPWVIDLAPYLHDYQDPQALLRWYVTNESFITAQGENITGNMAMTMIVPKDAFGNVSLTFILINSIGATASQKIDVMILPVNDPPYISPAIPDQIKPENSDPWSFDLTGYLHDVDNPIGSLRWYVLNEGAMTVFGENITGDEAMIFLIPKNFYGTQTMDLYVVDPSGDFSHQTLKVIITFVNAPPKIENIPDFSVHYDIPYDFNFAPYVSDDNTPKSMLNLSFVGSNSSYVTFNGLIGTFMLPKSLNNTEVGFVIRVDDGSLTDETGLSVLVTANYVPTVKSPLPDVTLQQGEFRASVFNLSDYFTDIDDSTIFFTSGNSHVQIIIHQQTNLVDFRAPPDWYGTEEVVFRAIDPSNARAEDSIMVTVVPGSKPPILSALPDLVVRYDSQYELDMTPYVYDPDTPMNQLSFTTNLSDYITFSAGRMIIYFPIDFLNETLSVILTVGDGGPITDRGVFHIKVITDYPPICGPLPDFSFYEDSPVPYPATGALSDFFSDRDQSSLNYSVRSWDQNITASISMIGGKVSIIFTQVPHWRGVTKLTIRGTDSVGGFAERTIILTVIPINYLPVIGPIGVIRVVTGDGYTIDISGNISDIETPIGMLLISTDIPQYIHGLSGTLYLLFPRGFTGSQNRTELNMTLKIKDLDGGEAIATVKVIVERGASDTTPNTQEVYFWWFLFTTAAIAGLIALLAANRLLRKPFVVENLMLIHNKGLLLARSARGEGIKVDDDIFSGMLTAVLSFVEDSFKANDNEMKRFEFKDYSVAIQRGANSFLAVAYAGSTPKELDKITADLMAKIESIYGKRIEGFSGDAAAELAGIDIVFNTFIHDYSKGPKNDEKAAQVEKA